MSHRKITIFLRALSLIVFAGASFCVAQTKPSASNTGPRVGGLTSTSGRDITVDSTTISEEDIGGTLHIKADNVTIVDCEMTHGGLYAINNSYGATGLTIQYSLIGGQTSAGILGGSNVTIEYNEIYDQGRDAIKVTSDFIVRNNYIHSLGSDPASHADGLQMVSGSNGVINENFFDQVKPPPSGYKNSSCLMIQTNNGVIDNIDIYDNWFYGGAYSININDKSRGYGAPTDIQVYDNLFDQTSLYGEWTFSGGIQGETPLSGSETYNLTNNRLEVDNSLIAGQLGAGGATETVANPVIALAEGFYASSQTTTITCATAGATIYYTTDGTAPTTSSNLYSSAIELDSDLELTAFAVKAGLIDSSSVTKSYDFQPFDVTDQWQSIAFAQQSEDFTLQFDFEPDSTGLDLVIGLSDDTAGHWDDLTHTVRFFTNNEIDAINGGTANYESINTIAYDAASVYTIIVSLDWDNMQIDATVSDDGAAPVTLATNYAARTTNATPAELDIIGVYGLIGSGTLSNILINGSSISPSATLTRSASSGIGLLQ